jgi:hypothetical protein
MGAMSKNKTSRNRASTIQILKRWIEMDYELIRGHGMGLRVASFAKRHNVDSRTVRRDLKVFARLGRVAKPKQSWKPLTKRWTWLYARGVKPLFFENEARSKEIKDLGPSDA